MRLVILLRLGRHTLGCSANIVGSNGPPDLCLDFVQHGLQAVSVPGEAGVVQLLALLHLTLEASNARLLLQDCLQACLGQAQLVVCRV